MSDLCMYELEDNVWDEFGGSDDHIVPHTVKNYADQFNVLDDGRKKPRQEVIGVISNANSKTNYGILGEKEKGLHTLNKNRMIEKHPWSHCHDDVFPTSGDKDPLNEATVTSDDSRMSSSDLKTGNIDSVCRELCADDPVSVDKCDIEDDNVYHYPLNQISQNDDDLSFFNNDSEDKDNGDLLYYGWGDIGNFEDVDRMFRSCDSTFGLESLNNEDDLCWFSSSSQATEGSHDPLKADTKLYSVPNCFATSRPDCEGPPTSGSNKTSVFLNDEISPLNISDDNAGFTHVPSLNVPNEDSGNKDNLVPNRQVSSHKKQPKQLSPIGDRKEQPLENGGSFHHYAKIKEFADVKNPFSESSCRLFPSQGLQSHKRNIGSDSVSYVQTNVPYMHVSYSSPCATLSGTKSENNGHPSSTMESSYASNQVQSLDSPQGPSFEAPTGLTNEKRGKLYHRQETQVPFNGNIKHAKKESQMTFCDPITVQKQTHQTEQDDGHSEVEGVSVGKPAELDSSNAQESSCVSSILDEVSLEATSFRQLQQVMEKLDIRTKLCIRDSLYRLARSAELRHNCMNTHSGVRDDKDASGPLVVEETNKCAGFMDIETDTNPIDRSIAHLLFHRPSDPSLRPTKDAASFNSHDVLHGPIGSPPLMAEKYIDHEDTGAASDRKC